MLNNQLFTINIQVAPRNYLIVKNFTNYETEVCAQLQVTHRLAQEVPPVLGNIGHRLSCSDLL
jgi:hypothetical protein